jgi:general secretion pathway protein G
MQMKVDQMTTDRGPAVPRRGGFSLVELVIVVVIIAVIGAIAIPRLSRGAAGANDSALIANTRQMRQAIEHYSVEHGGPPTLAQLSSALTQYTDETGASASVTPDDTHVFGPYIRSIPAVNTGPRAGQNGIGLSDGPTIGWIYVESSGDIRPNVPGAVPLDGELEAQLTTP